MTLLFTKKLFSALSLNALLISSCFAQLPTNGLVGNYPFNGNANNTTGMNNGVVNGATLTTGMFGSNNSAYYFDGSDDYIQLPTPYDLSPRTISLWFYIDNIGSESRIYTSDNPNLQSGMSSIRISNTSGSNKMNIYLGYQRASASITLNSWHNVVLVVNDNSPNDVYLNCTKLTTTYESSEKSIDGYSKTILGSNRLNNGHFFEGKIDDIRIYDRALAANEIQDLCESRYAALASLTQENTFNIFPNPTNGLFSLDFGNSTTQLEHYVKITNSIGQTIYTSEINEQIMKIDATAWNKNGIYFIQILDSNNNILDVKKLIYK